MGGPEREALKALSKVGKAKYELDKATEMRDRNGAYSNTRDRMIAGAYNDL